jgi:hypothetical protein
MPRSSSRPKPRDVSTSSAIFGRSRIVADPLRADPLRVDVFEEGVLGRSAIVTVVEARLCVESQEEERRIFRIH